MSAAAAARQLSPTEARALTRDLQRLLDGALELVGQLYAGRAWSALGYGSWGDYCAAELPQLAIIGKGLPAEQRRAVVVALHTEHGMSRRAVAAPLGLSPSGVQKDLAAAGGQLAEVVGLDGRRLSGSAPARAPRPRVVKTDRAVQLVAAAGPEGLDVFGLVAATRWRQSMASATLHRLARAGRLAYVAPERRGLVGRYVVR